MSESAFNFIQVAQQRTRNKPRTSGLSSLIDYGIPLNYQKDLLGMAAHLIDIAKIATATPLAYDKRFLMNKLEIYKEYNVVTQMGGQFAEYAFYTAGLNGVKRLFNEANTLGFKIVEISDTCKPLSENDRQQLIAAAKNSGLRVVCEVGLYEGNSDTDQIISDIQFALENKVEFVIVEGAELVDGEGFKSDVIALIRDAVDISRLIFEMPGPGISDASPAQLEALKRGLILEFGPDVNLGNLQPDEIIETEIVRLGVEDKDGWPELR